MAATRDFSEDPRRMTDDRLQFPPHPGTPPDPASVGSVGEASAAQGEAVQRDAFIDPDVGNEWQPVSKVVEEPGVMIEVRSVELFRFHPYKPEGARQMRKRGRWQKLNGYGGWDNAELPGGDFKYYERGARNQED